MIAQAGHPMIAQCDRTRGGVQDRRGPAPVVVGGYRCSLKAGHKGPHVDKRPGKAGHRWA